jgi:adenylate cyclase
MVHARDVGQGRHLAAIMFTDLQGFTSTTHANEESGLRLLREQEKLAKPVLDAHHGRLVKSMGDGLLIEFRNALEAVRCAVELQRYAHERNRTSVGPPLQIRVGIHVGDIERRGSDIVGDSVNIAARIEPLAEPGGVCLSAQVVDQVRNKVPYQISRMGLRSLKGIREPVDIYRIVLPWLNEAGCAQRPSPHRLAVLPLVNISPDPKDDYFADGLTEELISVLSQIRGLRVISRTSVNQYRGTTKSTAQIGSELGVGALLEGSVRKSDDQLRIAIQLIDPGTDEHLWTQTFDRKLANVFAIQSEVAQQIAGVLTLQLAHSELRAIGRPPTANLGAYALYLQGLHASHSTSPADWDRAIEYFEAAVRADPEFSLAYAHLGNALLAVAGETRPIADVVVRAREVIARALALEPDSPEAHEARGNLAMQIEHDWQLAEKEFDQAIRANPSSSAGRLWYGVLLLTLRRFEEAKEQLRLAAELDPGVDWVLLHLARAYLGTGDVVGATSVAEDAVARFPRSTTARILLANCLAIAGDLVTARREADIGLQIAHDEHGSGPWVEEIRFWRAIVYSRGGDVTEVRALLGEMARTPANSPLSPTMHAGLLTAAGETDNALALLEDDVAKGSSNFWFDYLALFFDPLRGHPRFEALLRAEKLPTSAVRPARQPSRPQE